MTRSENAIKRGFAIWFLTLGSSCLESREIRAGIAIPAGFRRLRSPDPKLPRDRLSLQVRRFFVLASTRWRPGFGSHALPPTTGYADKERFTYRQASERTIATLPPQARNMLDEVVNSGFVNDSKRIFAEGRA